MKKNMSLIITSFVNEGIVMAADSRATLSRIKPKSQMIYEMESIPFSDTANKLFAVSKFCAVSVCGDFVYKDKPISGYIDKFTKTLEKGIDIVDIPQRLLKYFTDIDKTKTSIFHVAGYSIKDNEAKTKLYRVVTGPQMAIQEVDTQTQGARWDGETEILCRLVKQQVQSNDMKFVQNLNLDNGGQNIIIPEACILSKDNSSYYPETDFAWQVMSLQDAVNISQFAIETTIKMMKFWCGRKTVGGPIDLLVITPTGLKWLKQKKLQVK